MSERKIRSDPWGDDDDAKDAPYPALTPEQARQWRQANPILSPWKVITAQVVVGGVMAALVWLVTGRQEMAWSALYGAAVVVVPSALMARGMTSRLSRMAPVGSAVSFMLWESVKIMVSIAMLMLAPKLVRSLSWPALLAALAVCMSVYWFALLWRGRKG